jgi:site-specific recombinase XerD
MTRRGDLYPQYLLPIISAVSNEPADAFDRQREQLLLGYSLSTARLYLSDLEDWREWCDEARIDPMAPSSRGVARYLDELSAAGYSRSAVARRLVALRLFLDLGSSRGTNPARRVHLYADNRSTGRRASRNGT